MFNLVNSLIFSYDSFIDSRTNKIYDGLDKILDIYQVAVISHDNSKLAYIKNKYDQVSAISRSCIRNVIQDINKKEYFAPIVIGTHDVDLYLAANLKLCLLNALWFNPQDTTDREKVMQYGLPVRNISELILLLEIFFNNNGWYSVQEIDDQTTVLSLMNARTNYNSDYSRDEKCLIEGFQSLLKNGNRTYYEILLYYLLGNIVSSPYLRDVQNWGIFPSSTTTFNEEMLNFKDHTRYIMNGKTSKPIFLRSQPVQKSHYISNAAIRIPCNRHLDTIYINPYYKNKLTNRTVCIFDDYLTNGTSFETARNLLLNAGVKKIYFISLGTFCKNYIKQDYRISGNIYAPKYSYNLLSQTTLPSPTFNNDALEDIRKISDLLR